MRTAALTLCLIPLSTVLLRAQEIPADLAPTAVSVVVDKKPVVPLPRAQTFQARQFEERFNKLVRTVAEFALAYNQNHGQTWPADKAAALRKAMLELQKIDPNFKPDLELKASSESKSGLP